MPNNANFLAKGSKPLPKSYFQTMKGNGKSTSLKMGKPFLDTQNMRATAGSPQQNVMGGRLLGSFKKGGMIKKTGNYKLHKGEKVVSKSQLNKKANKMFFGSKISK